MIYETPEIECTACGGYGWIKRYNQRLGHGVYEETCETCNGHGWRQMTPDEEADAAEEQHRAMMEDFHDGAGPLSLDEQHRATWKQKQALKATGGDHE